MIVTQPPVEAELVPVEALVALVPVEALVAPVPVEALVVPVPVEALVVPVPVEALVAQAVEEAQVEQAVEVDQVAQVAQVAQAVEVEQVAAQERAQEVVAQELQAPQAMAEVHRQVPDPPLEVPVQEVPVQQARQPAEPATASAVGRRRVPRWGQPQQRPRPPQQRPQPQASIPRRAWRRSTSATAPTPVAQVPAQWPRPMPRWHAAGPWTGSRATTNQWRESFHAPTRLRRIGP